MTFISASAYKYVYSFDNIPISEAIVRISKETLMSIFPLFTRNLTTTVLLCTNSCR